MKLYDLIKKQEEAERAKRRNEKLAIPKEMQFSARIAGVKALMGSWAQLLPAAVLSTCSRQPMQLPLCQLL